MSLSGNIDFSGLLNGNVDCGDGTEVIANPSGSATDTLNKIQIDDTIYSVEGGGGTEVIANPTGTPTENINTIKISDVIYQIVGEKGADGTDGTSAYASVSKDGNTATITCTDANGTTTAQISDGTNGTDGTDGTDGTSAYATVSKSGNTATITCTDANGTTTAQISDGTNGTDGQGVPTGGSAGQVLIKDSATDYDTSWSTLDASDIPYDNTTSGMTATDVQAAVTELKSNLIDYVDITVTTTSNAEVAPFSCFGETTLDNSIDINKVVGATIYDASLSYKNPAQAYVYTTSRRIRVYTKTAVTLTVRVLIKG